MTHACRPDQPEHCFHWSGVQDQRCCRCGASSLAPAKLWIVSLTRAYEPGETDSVWSTKELAEARVAELQKANVFEAWRWGADECELDKPGGAR